MKAIVVYDTLYSNTEQIAKAIGGAIEGEAQVVRAAEADAAALGAYDLVIVGSPTQGGRYTPAMKNFLDKVPADALKNKKAAAFDTRHKSWFVKVFGWAANRIADDLKEKGAALAAPGEGFLVKSTRGPLVEGELERAAAWAKAIVEK